MKQEDKIAIKVENLSKTFRIPHEKISSLRGAFVGAFRKKTYEEFKALDDMKEKGLNKGIIRRSVFVVSLHFLAIDSMLKYATINLLKPPVLTARHGGVLLLK